MPSKRFPLGVDFPCEGFVQAAVERWGKARGLEVVEDAVVDVLLVDPVSRHRTLVEAKGMTTSPGLDFNTGLGQVLKRMSDPDARYAVAVPEHPKFRAQLAQIPDRVRLLLRLDWLVVDRDGRVEVIPAPGA